MTDASDRQLTAWLREGPEQGPVAALERTLAETRRTAQRPGWSFPERWLPMQLTFQRGMMPRTLALLAVTALLLAGLVTAVLLIGGPTRVPDPFGPAANGTLVMAVDGELVAIDPDGLTARPLGGGEPILGSAPSFSRDGQRLAYWSRAATDQPTWLVVADPTGTPILGLDSTSLPGFAATAASPSLSPDGSRVAIVLTEDAEKVLYVIDVGTRALTPMTTQSGSISEPVWSPDGRWIATRHAADGDASLVVTAADGAETRTLVTKPDQGGRVFQGYGWSPTSDRLVYHYLDQGGDVATVGLAGDETLIATDPVSEFNPVFSPDGRSIAFLAADGAAVDIAAADGTARRTLIEGAFAGTGCPIWWAPDGRSILGSPAGTDCGPTDSGALIAVDVADPSIVRRFELPGRLTGLPSWQRLAP